MLIFSVRWRTLAEDLLQQRQHHELEKKGVREITSATSSGYEGSWVPVRPSSVWRQWRAL
jgi:hypothetical protein